MVTIYKTNVKEKKLRKIDKPVKGCWINMVCPNDGEIKRVSELTGVKEHFIRYSLDIAEKAHIDIENEDVLIVVDSPYTEIKNGQKIYTTMPFGMILVRDDFFITVSQVKINSIEKILSRYGNHIETEKKSRLVFSLLFDTSEEYIRYLTYINKDLEEFEHHMEKTMSNKELLRIMNFEKSMVYFNASVKGNQVVLEKLYRGKTIKLYEADEDILEDTMIENRQAIEMIQTYSDILNGIVDMFGTMVSNNLNSVMKLLTSITLVISVPTMIASFLGMNVEFPFSTNVSGFYIILALSIIVSIIVTIILKKRDML